jgi:hypothetical protein
MSNLYSPYITPPGCHDVPYIYMFDGTGLTNGTSVNNTLSTKLDGDAEFILRRIAGASSIAQFFAYRNYSNSYAWLPAAAIAGPQADISVVPEKHYPRESQIRFDLATITKAVAVSGGTDFLAYLAFQGVKRFPWEKAPYPCPGYITRGYQYVLNVGPVTWTRGNHQRFSVRINAGLDFELHRIIQLDTGTATPPLSGGVPLVTTDRVGVFNYWLYDSSGYPLSNAPVPDSYIIDQISPIFQADPAPMPGVFPCPGILYPRQSQILVDLYAVQSVAQGNVWQIIFDGMERIPVSGPVNG